MKLDDGASPPTAWHSESYEEVYGRYLTKKQGQYFRSVAYWIRSGLATSVEEPMVGKARRFSKRGYGSANVLLDALQPDGPTTWEG